MLIAEKIDSDSYVSLALNIAAGERCFHNRECLSTCCETNYGGYAKFDIGKKYSLKDIQDVKAEK